MKMLSQEKAKVLYYYLVLSRKYEEKANQFYREGKITEKPLSGIGQEAVSVGATFSLKKEDYVLPSLRTKGAFLTKGITAKECFLELFKKENSLSKGFWTSHHMGDIARGVILSSALVSSSLPVATGIALSAKLRKTKQVVVAFFGDGGSSRGDFHVSLNFAAVHDLPIVFVCENNQYALSTFINQQMKNTDIADRAYGYGIPGEIVDGQDVVEVYLATEKAIHRARKGCGPTLLECKTYRFRGHTESHDPDDGRPEEELKFWRERCPIMLYKKYLLRNTGITTNDLVQIDAKIERELEEAVEFAINSPDPSPEGIEEYVYAK